MSRYRGQPRRPDGQPHPAVGERLYDDEEAVFLQACDAYRRQHGLRFLTLCDTLAVFKGLGYRRPEVKHE